MRSEVGSQTSRRSPELPPLPTKKDCLPEPVSSLFVCVTRKTIAGKRQARKINNRYLSVIAFLRGNTVLFIENFGKIMGVQETYRIGYFGNRTVRQAFQKLMGLV